MAVTIYDVAKAAGVGISTVSRVLNENANVRPETRKRVLNAIEALDYKPNLSARNLSRPQVRSVGVVLSYLTNPFQISVLQGIERALSLAGVDLIIYNIDSHARRESLLENLSHGRRSDGLIVISIVPSAELVQRFQRYNVPVVIADHRVANLPSVYMDNVRVGQIATAHLLHLDHRRIAYIQDFAEPPNGPQGSWPGRERRQGYERALEEAGISLRPDFTVMGGGLSRRRGAEAAEVLLDRNPRPTAIFAASDMLALGVIEYAREASMQIPRDLAVIGCDDIELASFANLSTVRLPMEQMGQAAAEMVLQLMDGKEPVARSVELPVELVVRGSCGARQPTALGSG